MSDGIQGAASAAPAVSFEKNEAIIERGLQTFVDVGRALMRIRDGKQYRPRWQTFEGYCQERWQMSRPRAYELIAAAVTVESVSANADISPPASEGVARELKGTPEEKAEQWEATVERHGPTPTARQTRATVRAMQPEPEPEPDPDAIPEPGEEPEPEPEPAPHTERWRKTSDPRVIEWVRQMRNLNWNRKQIVDASKAGAHGWPLNDRSVKHPGLSNGAHDAIVSGLDAEPRADGGQRSPAAEVRAVRERMKREDGPLTDVHFAVAEGSRLMEQAVKLIRGARVHRLPVDDPAAATALVKIWEEMERSEFWWDVARTIIEPHIKEIDKLRLLKVLEDPARLGSMEDWERTANERAAERIRARLRAAREERPQVPFSNGGTPA